MTCPNKEEIYSEYMPSYNIKTCDKRQIIFSKYMKENSKVKYLYPIDSLTKVKKQHHPYHMQDTHWNSVGAYIGLIEIQKLLNKEYIALDNISVEKIKKTGGDLANLCGYVKTYDDYIVNYKKEIEIMSNGEGNWISTFSSNANSVNKAVVIGDSFREKLSPLLAKDYKNTYVSHRGYMKDPIIVEQIKNLTSGDLLLVESVERFDYSLLDTAEELIEILNK